MLSSMTICTYDKDYLIFLVVQNMFKMISYIDYKFIHIVWYLHITRQKDKFLPTLQQMFLNHTNTTITGTASGAVVC